MIRKSHAAAILGFLSVASPTLAAAFTWANPASPNARYWGLDANWSGTGVPNANVDTVSFSSAFQDSYTRVLELADAGGVDASFTIKSWSMSSSSSGNRAYSVSNVTGGTGVLIMEADAGNASISASTNNNGSTFNVGVQLNSNLSVSGGGSTGGNKVTFGKSITESGGTRSVMVAGTVQGGVLTVVNLNASNAYGGGTTVNGGNLNVAAAGTLGTGNLAVNFNATHSPRVTLNAAAAIEDLATLSLTSNGTFFGQVNLNFSSAASEVVGGLVIDGVAQPAGTYNAGTHPNFLLGTGNLQVVPEPASMTMLGVAAAALLRRRRGA